MAQNRNPQPQDQDSKGTTNVGRPSEASRSRPDDQSSDRERSIETRRDGGGDRGRDLSHRSMTAPVYGRGRTPFSLMRTMMDDMDRFFENFSFGGLRSNLLRDGTALADAVWSPQVETFRRGDKLVIRADLPGLRKDDVNVDVDNDMLTLTGERRDEHEEERDGFYRTERTYGRFYRAIPLPPEVNADQVEASFKDGVLEVSLPAPREEGARRKRIAVR